MDPGCGKSQVVLSVILNSWAQGDSVLFASNNNQAVDVVRERLKPFEDVFPISVRAGARYFSNVQDVFQRVINTISYGTEGMNHQQFSPQEKRVATTKESVADISYKKLPQMINKV